MCTTGRPCSGGKLDCTTRRVGEGNRGALGEGTMVYNTSRRDVHTVRRIESIGLVHHDRATLVN